MGTTNKQTDVPALSRQPLGIFTFTTCSSRAPTRSSGSILNSCATYVLKKGHLAQRPSVLLSLSLCKNFSLSLSLLFSLYSKSAPLHSNQLLLQLGKARQSKRGKRLPTSHRCQEPPQLGDNLRRRRMRYLGPQLERQCEANRGEELRLQERENSWRRRSRRRR